MQDIKQIIEKRAEYQRAAKIKNIDINIEELIEVNTRRVQLLKQIEELRSRRNEINDEMVKSAAEVKAKLLAEGKSVKEKLEKIEADYQKIKDTFDKLMSKVPTIPAPDTPIGKDEKDNVVIYEWGEIPKFDFKPKSHIELGKILDIIDLERGAKVSGYRGYYLKNEGATLALAVMIFAMGKMVAKGYTPMIPPTLVKSFPLYGSGYFKERDYNPEVDEIYQIASRGREADGSISKEKKFLVGTAEPSLLAYWSGETLPAQKLPIRVCGFSQCYRSEIGSYGKDTKGIYRVHEFMKVEQVIICEANVNKSDELQQEMISISKELHEELKLPYRQLRMCSGEMSPGKYKFFDIEAWLPGLNRWGETGSASNFLDWQARRLNVKYKTIDGEKKFVYMLNNTALASARTLIAILENFQNKDGSVKIPEVLRKYIPGNPELIKPRNS